MINKAEQSLDNSLVLRIADLERQMRELKAAPQPVGGDLLPVVASGGAVVGPVNLLPNSWVVLTSNTFTTPQRRTLWVRYATVYVDALDHQHAWPSVVDGTGVLTPEQQNLSVTVFNDREDTDFDTGESMIKVYILNRDTASHNVWVRFRSFLPKLPI